MLVLINHNWNASIIGLFPYFGISVGEKKKSHFIYIPCRDRQTDSQTHWLTMDKARPTMGSIVKIRFRFSFLYLRTARHSRWRYSQTILKTTTLTTSTRIQRHITIMTITNNQTKSLLMKIGRWRWTMETGDGDGVNWHYSGKRAKVNGSSD